MKRKSIFAAGLILFATSLGSCQSTMIDPKFVSGLFDDDVVTSITESTKSIAAALEEITPEQEYYIGRAVAGTILSKYSVYKNESVRKYLNMICNALVINSDMPERYNGYSVVILDTNEINAFSTCGGHILVTKGLLKCCETEDALAAVIAHELGHIMLGHSIASIKANRTTAAITSTTRAALVTVTAGNKDALKELTLFDDEVNGMVTNLMNSGYSQSQEYEADKKALELMAGAGYSPREMDSMLSKIDDSSSFYSVGLGKTHPSPKLRKINLAGYYVKYSKISVDKVRTERFKKYMKSL